MVGLNISGRANPLTPPPPTVALYGALGGSSTTSDLYTIDPATGDETSIGPIGFALTGLAFRPSDGVLFGATSNNSTLDPRSLITIDPATGDGTLVGGFGFVIPDITFRSDDVLFGYHGTNHRLHTINTSTGTATQVSTTVLDVPQGMGLAFNSTDTLYVFPEGTAGVYYIIDPATGGKTSQGALSGATFTSGIINAAAFDAVDLAWVSVFYAGPSYSLATVDVTTDTIASIGATVTRLDALAWGPA